MPRTKEKGPAVPCPFLNPRCTLSGLPPWKPPPTLTNCPRGAWGAWDMCHRQDNRAASHARLPPQGAHSWVPCLPATQGASPCRVGGGGWGARQEYGEKASGILLKRWSRQSARPRGCAGTLAWPCVRPLMRNVPVTGSHAVGMHSLYVRSCGAYSGPGLQGFLGKPEAHEQNFYPHISSHEPAPHPWHSSQTPLLGVLSLLLPPPPSPSQPGSHPLGVWGGS